MAAADPEVQRGMEALEVLQGARLCEDCKWVVINSRHPQNWRCRHRKVNRDSLIGLLSRKASAAEHCLNARKEGMNSAYCQEKGRYWEYRPRPLTWWHKFTRRLRRKYER